MLMSLKCPVCGYAVKPSTESRQRLMPVFLAEVQDGSLVLREDGKYNGFNVDAVLCSSCGYVMLFKAGVVHTNNLGTEE